MDPNRMLGRKVKTHVHHAKMAKGDRGTVTSVHNGVFYGVAVGGGIAYLPAHHADTDSTDTPGQPDTDGDASADAAGTS